jgi:hypothetical protein
MLIVAVLPNFFAIARHFPVSTSALEVTRIRLSPASSGFRARQVGAARRQDVQAEFLVEILVRLYSTPPCND